MSHRAEEISTSRTNVHHREAWARHPTHSRIGTELRYEAKQISPEISPRGENWRAYRGNIIEARLSRIAARIVTAASNRKP